MWAIIDTGASLNTGNLEFFSNFARFFPHTVEEIIVSGSDSGFTSISLSGIVRDDVQGETTTELPVIFCFRLPYKTKEGKFAILKVACGKDVSVTFLLGMPFLKNSQAKFCFETDRLLCPVFPDEPSFPIEYREPGLVTSDKFKNTLKPLVNIVTFKSVLTKIGAIMSRFKIPGNNTIPPAIKRSRLTLPSGNVDYGIYGPQGGLPTPAHLSNVAVPPDPSLVSSTTTRLELTNNTSDHVVFENVLAPPASVFIGDQGSNDDVALVQSTEEL